MRVSGGWNWEWCHYTPHFISFNQVLQGFVMYCVCRFLRTCSASSWNASTTTCSCVACLNNTNYLFFFLSNGSRMSESWPGKVTYSMYINGNMAKWQQGSIVQKGLVLTADFSIYLSDLQSLDTKIQQMKWLLACAHDNRCKIYMGRRF